jgi:hypothetical protein
VEDETGADEIGEDETGEDEIEEDETGGNETGEDEIREDETGGNEIGEDEIGEDEIREDEIGDDVSDAYSESKCDKVDIAPSSDASNDNAAPFVSELNVVGFRLAVRVLVRFPSVRLAQ